MYASGKARQSRGNAAYHEDEAVVLLRGLVQVDEHVVLEQFLRHRHVALVPRRLHHVTEVRAQVRQALPMET
jgi:hypothetical protein